MLGKVSGNILRGARSGITIEEAESANLPNTKVPLLALMQCLSYMSSPARELHLPHLQLHFSHCDRQPS